MSPRLAIVAGLLAGLLAGAGLLVALVAFAPAPVAPSPSVAVSPSPTTAPPSASPSGSAVPSPSASVAPSPSASLVPTPAASTAGAAFGIGEAAPALVVTGLDGAEIDLQELRGGPVWIVFMATWCPTCLDEFPLMNGFAARYADEGLTVIAVDLGEDEATVRAYAESLGVLFPMGLDPDGSAAEAWGVLVPPIHFFVDAEGIVRDGALGGIGPDVMAASLRTIMPGVDVQP